MLFPCPRTSHVLLFADIDDLVNFFCLFFVKFHHDQANDRRVYAVLYLHLMSHIDEKAFFVSIYIIKCLFSFFHSQENPFHLDRGDVYGVSLWASTTTCLIDVGRAIFLIYPPTSDIIDFDQATFAHFRCIRVL